MLEWIREGDTIRVTKLERQAESIALENSNASIKAANLQLASRLKKS